MIGTSRSGRGVRIFQKNILSATFLEYQRYHQ